MILMTRLASFYLILVLSFPLSAQSVPPVSHHWQMSVGAQYAQGRATNLFAAQPLEAFSYGGNLEYVLVLPKLTMTYLLYVGFQQLKAEGKDIVAPRFLDLEETLRVDNIVIGPGLEVKLNNKGKYHPLIGAQAFWGASVNSEYTFENMAMVEVFMGPLPVTSQIKNGAGLYTGGQIFAGLESVLTEKIQLRVKGALGGHYQFASWQLPFPIYPFYAKNNTQLIRGGYWQASVEVIHRL